ncbi:MAG: cytochrome C [Lentisphaerae bacterium]|nr:cytochrome C [Lentisphaerota bacterium]
METLKHLLNLLSDPRISFPILMILFFFIFPPTAWFEKWNKRLHFDRLWTPVGGLVMHGLMLVALVAATLDPNFRLIVTKPDNVPIVILIFGSVYFLWLSMRQARDNDQRLEAGEKPDEYCDPKRRDILVWPDVLYIELIAMILCMAFIIIWSLYLQAPLEQPANPALAPNPAKAPWYFLALQEMLVYFDPWLAGVVFPTLIIVGLIALPYLDSDRAGSGFYSFSRRKLFISLFCFGWLLLWVYLIIVGTFLRGPNWNFFGPFEVWDAHKVVPMNNVNLSELIWIKLLHRPLPNSILLREAVGILGLLGYLFVLPPLLEKSALKRFAGQMGRMRYGLFMFLSLMGLLLPIKMILRWTLSLKYLVSIPGWFNI